MIDNLAAIFIVYVLIICFLLIRTGVSYITNVVYDLYNSVCAYK